MTEHKSIDCYFDSAFNTKAGESSLQYQTGDIMSILFVCSDRKRYVSSSLGLTALSHLPKMCSSLGLFLAFCSAIQDAPPQSAALIKDLCEDR